MSYDSSGSDSDGEPKAKKVATRPGLVAYDSDSDVGSPAVASPDVKYVKHSPRAAGTASAAAAPEEAGVDAPAGADSGVAVEPAYAHPPCDPAVQEDIRKLLAAHGSRFLDSIRSVKEFNNPYSLEKVAKFFEIDNVGSCYPASSFDPHGYAAEDYYERIASVQKVMMDPAQGMGASGGAGAGASGSGL